MKHNTARPLSSDRLHPISTLLRDGLIVLSGLGVAAGSLLNQEITMWWIGA